MGNAVLIHPDDDVVTVVEDVPAEAEVAWDDGASLSTLGAVPAGHKVAVIDLDAGAVVRKYGHPIGAATRSIRAGEHVHTHNMTGYEGDR